MGIDYRIGHCATSLQNAGMKTSAGFAVYLLAQIELLERR
jgi:hypothetical protein